MDDDIEKIPSKIPLEQFDVSRFPKDKIREMFSSGRIPTAEAMIQEILLRAFKGKATDLHLEPTETELRIRLGQEGVLKKLVSLPREVADSLTSILKTKAGVNAFEKKKTQEGRFSMTLAAHEFDIRLNTIPILSGERVALRILRKNSAISKLEELGFSAENLGRVQALLRKPAGLFLATGPAGSGKSTTVYAAVNSLQSPEKNILTIEDPVEYKLEYASQVAAAGDKTVTFAEAIRSILRQNPNVIMIGEIRDVETCIAAAEAAVTGNLVLSTMLSSDGVGTIHRLLHLGVPPYWLSSSLSGVVYQLMVRKICTGCREEVTPPEVPPSFSGAAGTGGKFFRGKGCPTCENSGYLGRTVIHEIVSMTDGLRDLIYRNGSIGQMKEAAKAGGFEGISVDAAKKVNDGIISIEEYVRVFG